MSTPEATLRALQLPAHIDKIRPSIVGDLMPIAEFIEITEYGALAPWDGSGYWANEELMVIDHQTNIWQTLKTPPSWATHVMWYNK